MSKQRIELDIPDDCEVKSTLQSSRIGHPWEESYIDVRVYLKPDEPLAIKACRQLLGCTFESEFRYARIAAEKAIAEFEAKGAAAP